MSGPNSIGGLVAAMLLAGRLAGQDPAPVWRIGSFDNSSNEFASGRSQTSAVRSAFVVGTSDPGRDWGAVQSVAEDGSSPRAIEFPLGTAPAPDDGFQLHLGLMFERTGIPALRVSINGHRGLFYLRPHVSNQGSDASLISSPIFSREDLIVPFPGAYLQAGTNTIALEVIATSDQTAASAGIVYDAVELSRRAGKFGARDTVEVLPSVFFRQRDSGLTEMVQAFVRYESKPQSGSLDLQIGSQHYRRALEARQDFGEEKFEFDVPEFPAATPVVASLTLDGREQDYESKVDPKRKWTAYIVPHVHLDVGYTDFQAKVGALQARILDEAMDASEKHPEFCFTTDGSWNLEQFMRTRSPADQARLIEAIRRKRLFVPANQSSLLLGFPTVETLIRSLYYSANFSREHDTPFDFAVMTDSPSYPWSYASVLASAGLKYFIGGSNNNRGPILLKGNLREQSPMWWVGPDGGRVLFWYAMSYLQMSRLFGTPPVLEAGIATLPIFFQTYEQAPFAGDTVILYGSQTDNQDLVPQQADLVRQWNERYAFPKLRFSGVREALEATAAHDLVHTESGDGGPYWEDDIPTHAYYAAIERVTESRAPSAEKLQALSALVNPRLKSDVDGLNALWDTILLYDEHNGAVPHAAEEHRTLLDIGLVNVKNAYAQKASQMVDELLQTGVSNLSDAIQAGPGSLIVFNTLNWERSGLVSADLNDGEEIVEASDGQAVPVEALNEGYHFHRVQFLAKEVPPVGYKVYRLRHSSGRAAAPDAVGPSGPTVENRYYRVELDPEAGAVRSIFDKTLQKELVDQASPYRFGQYLYVSGGDMPIGKFNGLLMYGSPPPALTIQKAGGGRLVSVRRTPYGWSARMESSGVAAPRIETELRLFDSDRKIEFLEHMKKREVYRREGVYLAFPFAMRSPEFQYENQVGVVDPARDMLPGAGMDWFTLQHWVSVQQDGMAGAVLPLDAAMVSLGDVIRGTWSSDFKNRPGVIFSNLTNNYHVPREMIDRPAAPVDDDWNFRYVVTSSEATRPADLSRLGWEEATPLEVNLVRPQDRTWRHDSPLDGSRGSFLRVQDPSVLLTAWKEAEDGDGMILRFLDLGGTRRSVAVELPLLDLSTARLTDSVERNLRNIPVSGPHRFSFDLDRYQIVTIRLNGKFAAGP